MSFTPGPWSVDKVEDSSYGDDDVIGFWIRGKRKDQCLDGMVVASIVSDCLEDEVDFNAHLIAAAPELLAALESALAELNKYVLTPHPEGSEGARDFCVKVMHIEHAIAKARGEVK